MFVVFHSPDGDCVPLGDIGVDGTCGDGSPEQPEEVLRISLAEEWDEEFETQVTATPEPEKLWRTAWEWASSGRFTHSPVTSCESEARDGTDRLRASTAECPHPLIRNPRLQVSLDNGATWQEEEHV